jgi:hypothetical protein
MVEATGREMNGGEKSSRWLPAVFFILAVICVDEKHPYSAFLFDSLVLCILVGTRIAKILGLRE